MSKLRHGEVDAIRAAALIGICIVNVPFMALPVEAAFIVQDKNLDKIAAFLVEGLFQLKFFLLFSFIFGWGAGTLQRSALQAGLSFKVFYFRRMGALLLIGSLHAVLVFSGDILVLYAVLGALLWYVMNYPPNKLIKLSLFMVPVSVLCLTVLAIVIDEMMANDIKSLQGDIYHLAGGFVDASMGRLTEWPTTLLFLAFLQGPLAMGAFLLGLAAHNTDFFHSDSAGYLWLKAKLPWLAALAIPTNALYACTMSGLLGSTAEWIEFIGFIVIAVGAPALSAIYLYWLIRWARRFNVPRLMIFAGRNSLSAYVLQGVLCGVIFGSYGAGLFNQLGLFELLLLSLVVSSLSIVAVGYYAKVFGRGPLEPLLRAMTGVK